MTDKPQHKISIVHNLIGSNAMTRAVLTDCKILHDTGKAKLIKGTNTEDQQAQVWLPNYWVAQVLTLPSSTRYLLKRDREYDLKFKLL